MSADQERVGEQLDRIIARTELRVEQQCANASTLDPQGAGAASAKSGLALMLMGLDRLKTLRSELQERI